MASNAARDADDGDDDVASKSIASCIKPDSAYKETNGARPESPTAMGDVERAQFRFDSRICEKN
jgi:hypothetical protein